MPRIATTPDDLAFICSRFNYKHDPDGDLISFICDETEIAQQVPALEKIAIFLTKSDETLFFSQTNRWGEKYFFTEKFGEILLCHTTSVLRRMARCLKNHVFTPPVAVFIKHAIALNFDKNIRELEKLPSYEVDAIVEKMNAFVTAVRNELRSNQQRIITHNFQRASKKNYEALTKYFYILFLKYSKLRVIRLNLTYKPHADLAGEASKKKAYAPPVKNLLKHRKTFFKYVRSQLKGAVVGFCWKLEYGLSKGFHHHVILFLNGDLHKEDTDIAVHLGEHWSNTITAGAGLYFSWNTQKKHYKDNSVGLMHSTKNDRWHRLDNAALYLTKSDNYIKLKLAGNVRTFGKGNTPKLNHKELGRPRSKKNACTFLQKQIKKSRQESTINHLNTSK